MTTIPSLDILKQKRTELLLAEVALQYGVLS